MDQQAQDPVKSDVRAKKGWRSEESFLAYAKKHLAATVAERLNHLDGDKVAKWIQYLSHPRQAEVFSHLRPTLQIDVALALPREKFAEILTLLSPDERTDVFQLLPEERRDEYLPLLAHAKREEILKLVSYEEGTAGSIMTSDYVTLAPQLTAQEAIEALRREAPRRETIYHSYVVDEARRLLGVVELKNLILASPQSTIEEIMRKKWVASRVEDHREDVAKKIAQYDLIALPVLDSHDALVGIVTVDDILDVAEEESTEDFHKLVSSGPITTGIREATFGLLYRKRMPWLFVLIFVNIFSGAGIAFFESTIQSMVALVFFLPMLIGSGGNAGAQSSTLMVRAIATGDVRMGDWFKILGKEVFVALAIGITMGFGVSLIGLYRGGTELAVVVASSMVIVVLVGSLIGASLPFLLTKFGVDPATASSPMITSLCDISGVFIYFGIATWYLEIGV